MLKRILWATDGSEAADLAFPAVEGVAAPLHAEVALFQIQRELVEPGEQTDEDELRGKFEAQLHALERAGCERTFLVATPGGLEETAREIASAAQRLNADLIVIGTHGHSGVTGPFLSFVTHRLLHWAPCPVLVVPAQVAAVDAEPLTAPSVTSTS